LAAASGIGGYPNKKSSVAVAAFDPVGCSVSDHTRTDPVKILHARESISKSTTDVRGCQAKYRCGRAVDTDNSAITIDYNDRKIDGIEQANIVNRDPTRSRSVA
jgi:hypothetical protein